MQIGDVVNLESDCLKQNQRVNDDEKKISSSMEAFEAEYSMLGVRGDIDHD
jgi:hypothetical protein